MLSAHFAVLGSTGTGKSTATALILHRICDAAPNGHMVMIDPHGEYSASFGRRRTFDVDNLQLPYWLMNLEEHAEILLNTRGVDRQRDRDILAKCLLAARAKASGAEKDEPAYGRFSLPLSAVRSQRDPVNEMGKLDRAGTAALTAAQDPVRGDPGRSPLQLHVLGHDGVGTMADVLAKMLRLPGNGKPTRSSTCQACHPK